MIVGMSADQISASSAYYHELFLRGKRFLAYNIPRTKVKNTGRRRPASPDSEPDFYKMTFLPQNDGIVGGGSSRRQNPSMSLTSLLLPQVPYAWSNSQADVATGPRILSTYPAYQVSNQFPDMFVGPGTAQAFPFPSSFNCLATQQDSVEVDLMSTLLDPILDDEPPYRR